MIPDGRNCWLKELEQLCQYPADLEPHDDNRYLLLQRPVECEPLLSLIPVLYAASGEHGAGMHMPYHVDTVLCINILPPGMNGGAQ